MWYDNDSDSPLAAYARQHASKTQVKTKVQHPQFGIGIVQPNSEQSFSNLGRLVHVTFEDSRFDGGYVASFLSVIS